MLKFKDFTATYAKLKKAAIGPYLIAVLYTDKSGKKSQRIIEPISVSVDPFDPALYAYCRMRKELRTFKLDKMGMIQILDEKYEPQRAVTVIRDIDALEVMKVFRQ